VRACGRGRFLYKQPAVLQLGTTTASEQVAAGAPKEQSAKGQENRSSSLFAAPFAATQLDHSPFPTRQQAPRASLAAAAAPDADGGWGRHGEGRTRAAPARGNG
jgi:hypothetical protein